MPRTIIALVSSFLFGSLGLLMAWLAYQVEFRTMASNRVVSGSDVLAAYGTATFIGAVLGFGMAVGAMWLFAGPPPRDRSSP